MHLSPVEHFQRVDLSPVEHFADSFPRPIRLMALGALIAHSN